MEPLVRIGLDDDDDDCVFDCNLEEHTVGAMGLVDEVTPAPVCLVLLVSVEPNGGASVLTDTAWETEVDCTGTECDTDVVGVTPPLSADDWPDSTCL